MKISSYTGGPVQTNGYLLETPAGNLLIDAPEGVSAWLQQRGTRVDEVLLTHQHYDHVGDAALLQQQGARLHAFAAYSKDLTLENAARSWGMAIMVALYQIDRVLKMDQALQLAELEITCAHVPGHSIDSVTFYFAAAGLLFSGDTLFAGSIGRTDLPGGDTQQLLTAITRDLMPLPPETQVFPGHGPSSTIGRELATNPYLE
jgi:hydroxyacylglutathione hydrolase